MDNKWIELLQQQNQMVPILQTNDMTQRFGLSLTEEEAKLVVAGRNETLREQRRVEFGVSITPRIIFEFCDSPFINQMNYTETLIRLQDIFFLFKNEMDGEITDDELLHFMKEQYDGVCFGDLDYLEGTCLQIFAQAIKRGYQTDNANDGYGEFTKLDKVPRWDFQLYMQALEELFG